MPQAIIAIAAIVVGEYAGVAVLVQVGVALLLSSASKYLSGNKRQFALDTTTQTVTMTDSVGPAMIIYGQVRTSGVSAFHS